MHAARRSISLCLPLFTLLACSETPPSVYQEVIDQGATRYFGQAKTSETKRSGRTTTYTFDPASGPVCLEGDPYMVSLRDVGSDELFFFLQGGGACWSEFCFAITKATSTIPVLDILDPDRETNPLASWNTVYLPYCDGSLFAGDSEHDTDGDGKVDRFQHGLQNLSAAIDVAAQRFPSPKRIVLAGSSGGGYGTILATLLVRAKYPGVEILVFNDAGIGLGKPEDPTFLAKILDELKIRPLLPKSCPECTENGHVTRLVDWELARDPQLKIAAFTSYEDFVISQVFMKVEAAKFKEALLAETNWLRERHPDRYRRFFIKGEMHTTLLGGIEGFIGGDVTAVTMPDGLVDQLGRVNLGSIDTTTLNGMSVAQWFKAMLDGSPEWDDRTE